MYNAYSISNGKGTFMTKRKSRSNQGRFVPVFLLFLAGLILLIRELVHNKNISLLNPKGVIANEQLRLMSVSLGIMLILAVPALTILYFTAWKYRETNEKATYSPGQKNGKLFSVSLWLVPLTFVAILANLMWPSTHKLDPRKQISSNQKPITIQVVAMRWKWLFIYPEQHIVTVNYIQVPIDTPIKFELTADETPMSSFWIPNLGGQLYAMTGHVNQLNLMGTTIGDYIGKSAEINGAGFAGMKFTARVSSQTDFNNWIKEVQSSSNNFDSKDYTELLVPSEYNKAMTYSTNESDIYSKVTDKYTKSHEHGE